MGTAPEAEGDYLRMGRRIADEMKADDDTRRSMLLAAKELDRAADQRRGQRGANQQAVGEGNR